MRRRTSDSGDLSLRNRRTAARSASCSSVKANLTLSVLPIAEDSHSEVLSCSAIGLGERGSGAIDLVIAGLTPYLLGRLDESEQARGTDRVRREHASGWVYRKGAADSCCSGLDH